MIYKYYSPRKKMYCKNVLSMQSNNGIVENIG